MKREGFQKYLSYEFIIDPEMIGGHFKEKSVQNGRRTYEKSKNHDDRCINCGGAMYSWMYRETEGRYQAR